uniref:Ig-like domain-containing protein n=1 Tax=Panagrellus redivivus TaxID=6233 RepID=A0A7E4VZF6_PANRE
MAAILRTLLFFEGIVTVLAAGAQLRLIQDMLDSYDRKAKPTWDNNKAVNVTFSMDLYQILELNEPQQYILLNAWIIERWNDEFLYWVPEEYNNITEIRLPHDSIWIPDTTLYENLVMKDDDTRRLLNAKLTTNLTRKAALVDLLYPGIFKFSCLLNLRYFPFDIQICKMTFSSWTYDQKGIDYYQHSNTVGTTNYLENEGWYLLKTSIERKEVNYSCCPNNYTLLRITLYLRRKPLFYLVNLIIPTAIITLIAIVGFFTTSSASGMREEKVSLGITTLLSMSILMLMVSDEMPTTSTFIPLIGWFILGMILIISLGTLMSSVVIGVQKRGRLGERLSYRAVVWTKAFGVISFTELPLHLRKGTKEYDECPPPQDAFRRTARHLSRRLEQAAKVGMLEHDAINDKDGSTKRTWFSFRQRHRNGIVNDKSTDPLVISSPTYASDDKISTKQLDPGALPPLPPPPASALRLTLTDMDDISCASDGPESSRPMTGRSFRFPQSKIQQHAAVFNENVRHNRQLAQKEYEWLATVMERCNFIIFVILFFIVTVGINMLGFYHWSDVDYILNQEPFNLTTPEIEAEKDRLASQ